MKLGIVNLGCPKNTVDTECMLSCLNSFSLTTSAKDADIILINTCAFIKEARSESEKVIRDMLVEKKKGAKIIVAGCFVSKDLQQLQKKFSGVHAWLGVNDFINIAGAIKKGGVYTGSAPYIYKSSQHTVMLNPYSAYVKISEGCNHRCSFCTIPAIKGKYRSREVRDIVREIKNLVDGEIKEINLISQDLTYFGRDSYGRPVLAGLICTILKKIKKYFWLRLLYMYPDYYVLKKIIGIMQGDARLCRYIDIPFQHVNDRILKSMRRGYGKKEIIRAIELLRSLQGGITIRSSFIAGYPGETEKESLELFDFIGAGFVDKAGVFAYSDEPGTHAHMLSGKIPAKKVEHRKKRLMLASSRVYYYNNKRQIGTQKKVLIIGKKGGNKYIARTQENAPDIDSYLTVVSRRALKTGEFYTARITGIKNFEPEGEAIAGTKP